MNGLKSGCDRFSYLQFRGAWRSAGRFAFCYAGWYSVNVAGLATGIVILVVMFLLRHGMNESHKKRKKAAA